MMSSDDITSGNYETAQCYALRHVTSGATPAEVGTLVRRYSTYGEARARQDQLAAAGVETYISREW